MQQKQKNGQLTSVDHGDNEKKNVKGTCKRADVIGEDCQKWTSNIF